MAERIFIEKKDIYNTSNRLQKEVKDILGIDVKFVRQIIRYDIYGLNKKDFYRTIPIFCEAPVDNHYFEISIDKNQTCFVVEYLEGQFDQRADSAMQCVQLLLGGNRPIIKCATLYIFDNLATENIEELKKYFINPVECKEGTMELEENIPLISNSDMKMRIEINNFISMDKQQLMTYYKNQNFAMSFDDLLFVQNYFIQKKRQPTETEIKVIDTYWSDHCRHTTFLTEIKSIEFLTDNDDIKKAYSLYKNTFNELYKDKPHKYECLMDIATIVAKKLKKDGILKNLDESDEINACSVNVDVDVDGKIEKWLIMFKNETHNHPTEIEPFGGAATCLGGAIRDPLSGRSYVYQAMRITGSGDPRKNIEETLTGKLPQSVISKTALKGFSSYGNQIGLATGIVREVYNEKYIAKRLEAGYVIGGVKKSDVIRKKPKYGDVVILLGGDTGRDGCGGATGSSKAHNIKSVELCGAEVQKGNAPEERKIQRLFRNPDASRLILKCNDFGAGGVAVAIGELSEGLEIYLDKVPKKYNGLSATELAISESQERMAVVVSKENADAFIAMADTENLKATIVAVVTDSNRLCMKYHEEIICDIDREFLDTNGVKQCIDVLIKEKGTNYFDNISANEQYLFDNENYTELLSDKLFDLNICSQKGLGEVFDSTIGTNTVLMPFGGKYQLTPSMVMASKPPILNGYTKTVTCSSYGIYTHLLEHSPFTGAIYSIIGAVSKLIASGVDLNNIYLSLQEFFKKLGNDKERWGEPVSALLGAMYAQNNLKIAAIGGKDSMSGSYEKLDVPPTLIAFAMGITNIEKLKHNTFNQPGYLYKFHIEKNENGTPIFNRLIEMYNTINQLISSGKVLNACVSDEGGDLVSVIKSLFGNKMGMVKNNVTINDFKANYGDIFILSSSKLDYGEFYCEIINTPQIMLNGKIINFDIMLKSFIEPLNKIFPIKAEPISNRIWLDSDKKTICIKTKNHISKPKVIIPVFPGTNCEYDMARAFMDAGADPKIYVINNLTSEKIQTSVKELANIINKSHILAFPGGFSGGDEPDGSGKFIASTFKNPLLMDAVNQLLTQNDGLILGICNGFQALIKLGLLPYGKICDMTECSPTLTYNDIHRHVSTIANIKITSASSPWLNECRRDIIYSVPVSHGEGKLLCDDIEMEKLINNNQIATQYVDYNGKITMESPFNPNGSFNSIEGLISPDGRIFGKMGHTERFCKDLYQNVEGNYDMPIFKSAVKYFE